MVGAWRLQAVVAVATVALVCTAQDDDVISHADIIISHADVAGSHAVAKRSDEIEELLDELEEDSVVTVRGRTPQQVLQDLLSAALAHNLTNPKAVEMMKRNIEVGRASVEKYIGTWSKALSKALDRAQKRRKQRRQEKSAEKQRAKVRHVSNHGAWRCCPSYCSQLKHDLLMLHAGRKARSESG